MNDGALVVAYADHSPTIDTTAWVAPNATLIGAVTLGPGSSVWFGAVLRADADAISVGARSNVQDGCVLHTDAGMVLSIGADVTVGHHAVLHGCTVEAGVLIGMNATILNGAHIGTGSIVAAGAVVLEGTEVPPNSLVAGIPARVRRATTEGEAALIAANGTRYCNLARAYARS